MPIGYDNFDPAYSAGIKADASRRPDAAPTRPRRKYFKVTYETITPESADNGDVETYGYAIPGGWRIAPDDDADPELTMTLADAVGIAGTGLQDCGRWFTTVDPDRDYATGEETYFAIHPPSGITASSYGRIRRALGIR